MADKDYELKQYYMACSCSSVEHMLVFSMDPDDEFPELWLDIFLADTVWYKRLWKGIQYIFGKKSKYGHFGNWSLDIKDIPKMQAMLVEYEDAYNKSKFGRKK